MDLTPPPLLGFADNCLSHAKCATDALQPWLATQPAAISDGDTLRAVFERLVLGPFKDLPRPAQGATLTRFSALADVAGHSLALAKLYEAHTDALAIMGELGVQPMPEARSWGVFAAEDPSAPLIATPTGAEECRLDGSKPWCSGAMLLTHALLTAKTVDGQTLLVAVELDAGLVNATQSEWQAVGMGLTQTSRTHFRGVRAVIVARDNQYITRAGFWHGAIGIAACWYGAAAFLGAHLRASLQQRHDDHGLAHLGAVACQLHAARAALQHAAQVIDMHPLGDARPLALATRAIVERAAETVLHHCGRALGAKPFCSDARFAQMAADLPVFLRQSHAERDLAALGTSLLDSDNAWTQLHSSL